MKTLLYSLAWFCLASHVWAESSLQLERRSAWKDPTIPIPPPIPGAQVRYLDVAAEDRYLYILTSNFGVRVFDLEFPTLSANLGSITLSSGLGQPTGLLISEGFLYVGSDRGVEAIDVRNKQEPKNLRLVEGKNLDWACSGNMLYLLRSESLVIVNALDGDISEFVAPWLSSDGVIASFGRYLCYAGGKTGGFYVLDTKNPSKTALVGRLSKGSFSTTDLVIDSKTAYWATQNGLIVLDLRVPSAPKALAWKTTLTAEELLIADGQIHARTGNLLQTLRIKDPANPAVVKTEMILGRMVASDGRLFSVRDRGIVIVESGLFISHEENTPATKYAATRLEALAVVRDTAFLAAGQAGLVVLSLRNSSAPTRTEATGLGLHALDVVAGEDAVFVADLQNRVAILEADSKMSLRILSIIPTGPSRLSLALDRDRLVIGEGRDGFQVVDVADLKVPKVLAKVSGKFEAKNLAVVGDLIYVAMGSNGLGIWSMVYPAEPRRVGTFLGKGSVVDVAVEGHHAYLVLEPPEISNADPGIAVPALEIVDSYNPSAPRLLSRHYTLNGERITDIAVKNGQTYLARGLDGVEILDVRDPVTPRRLALDRRSPAERIFVRDNWVQAIHRDTFLLYEISKAKDTLLSPRIRYDRVSRLFSLESDLGVSAWIETSPDLVHWKPWQKLSGGVLQWSRNISKPRQFYRLVRY